MDQSSAQCVRFADNQKDIFVRASKHRLYSGIKQSRLGTGLGLSSIGRKSSAWNTDEDCMAVEPRCNAALTFQEPSSGSGEPGAPLNLNLYVSTVLATTLPGLRGGPYCVRHTCCSFDATPPQGYMVPAAGEPECTDEETAYTFRCEIRTFCRRAQVFIVGGIFWDCVHFLLMLWFISKLKLAIAFVPTGQPGTEMSGGPVVQGQPPVAVAHAVALPVATAVPVAQGHASGPQI